MANFHAEIGAIVLHKRRDLAYAFANARASTLERVLVFVHSRGSGAANIRA